MLKLLLVIVGFSALQELTVNGQTGTEVRLKTNKPTVYITFERTGARKALEEGESEQGVWLRIHNNTKWKLVFSAGGVPERSFGGVVLFYEIERVEGEGVAPVGYRQGHVSSVIQLSPGRSLEFSVPQEHLAKGLAIRLNYDYEWELDQNGAFVRAGEPIHRVSFESSSLPY